ncbi:MAG: class IV adenylate cyclase [Anaerolineales bacterium]|uniref:Class IV adenylate cyclase n=1 Tax=Candidatus Desulfolinea nitratireducens TaxID=2841698 RepID=A0A8J6NL71_9CHLR|nr:class IV adenylate cyclase [Candidatus Desulfolinea nitratireducens]MBL6960656.1 class IV adenylate cyclase [Anaerolineales bacterium]
MKPTTETEVKFHIADVDGLAKRLKDIGAELVSPAIHEYNLRFDTQAGDIYRKSSVLRLRRDSKSHLTFKGKSKNLDGVLSREEIEFTVGDFESARKFLEALGYEVVAVYEKIRTEYKLGDLLFMMDKLPFGTFLEIEGPDVASIQKVARELHLNWRAAVKVGYLGILRRLCDGRELDETFLTFEALKESNFNLEDISIRSADI